MPMKIPLKFRSLPPACSATIAGALQRLAAVEEAMRPHDDTDEGEAVLSACAAFKSCILYAQRTESSARGMLSNASEAIEVAADIAASNVRADGYAGPGQYQAAVERARGEVVERYGAEAWKRTLDAEQDGANRHAAAIVNAMRLANRAVDLAMASHRGPAALRERSSMDDLATLAAIKQEEASKPPSAWLPTYEALISSGDEKSERAYVVAVKLLAQEIVAMNHSKLRERLGATGPDTPERREKIERERMAAMRFLDRVRERAEEMIPESLKLATLAMQELQGAFYALMGYHALTLPRDVYDRRRQGGRADPLDVEPSWPMRLGLATAKARR